MLRGKQALVPRIDLPSGAWVEYRDTLKANDRFEAQNSVNFEIEDGKVRQQGGITNQLRNALLSQIITGWSLTEQGIPIPALHVAGPTVLGELDIDDYAALSAAVEPLLQKVSWNNPNPSKPPPS